LIHLYLVSENRHHNKSSSSSSSTGSSGGSTRTRNVFTLPSDVVEEDGMFYWHGRTFSSVSAIKTYIENDDFEEHFELQEQGAKSEKDLVIGRKQSASSSSSSSSGKNKTTQNASLTPVGRGKEHARNNSSSSSNGSSKRSRAGRLKTPAVKKSVSGDIPSLRRSSRKGRGEVGDQFLAVPASNRRKIIQMPSSGEDSEEEEVSGSKKRLRSGSKKKKRNRSRSNDKQNPNNFQNGDSIEGNFQNDGHWYTGQIVKINTHKKKPSTFDVKYDMDNVIEKNLKNGSLRYVYVLLRSQCFE
jgi:hypothetical protein